MKKSNSKTLLKLHKRKIANLDSHQIYGGNFEGQGGDSSSPTTLPCVLAVYAETSIPCVMELSSTPCLELLLGQA